jgi:hypothetical protein
MHAQWAEVTPMRLDLTFEELSTLRMALDRTLNMMEHELVRTDAPSLQHALARDFEQMTRIRDLVNEQLEIRPPREVSGNRPSYDDRVL